jgi:hypothetical protein
LKTKYFSSEYKKPLCVELEDVKINKAAEIDLETQPQIHLEETSHGTVKMENDDETADARFLKWLQESSTSFLNYLLQFLPPTAMIMLQVIFCVIQHFMTFNRTFKSSF